MKERMTLNSEELGMICMSLRTRLRRDERQLEKMKKRFGDDYDPEISGAGKEYRIGLATQLHGKMKKLLKASRHTDITINMGETDDR